MVLCFLSPWPYTLASNSDKTHEYCDFSSDGVPWRFQVVFIDSQTTCFLDNVIKRYSDSIFSTPWPYTLTSNRGKTHGYYQFWPHTLGGRIHSICGRIHSIAGRIHVIAGRIHSTAGRIHSVAGRIHSIVAVYTQLISQLTWPYTLHQGFFSKSIDSTVPNASRVYSAPPYTLYSEDPGKPICQ